MHLPAGASHTPLGALAASADDASFPIVRVKCASLCWHTLNAALAQPMTTGNGQDPAVASVSTE